MLLAALVFLSGVTNFISSFMKSLGDRAQGLEDSRDAVIRGMGGAGDL